MDGEDVRKTMCRHNSLEILGSEGGAEKRVSGGRRCAVLEHLGFFNDRRYWWSQPGPLPSLLNGALVPSPLGWMPLAFPSSTIPLGLSAPQKPHHLFTWLLQPGSWGLMEKISNLVWRFLLGMCFLNWVSLSLGGLSIHPTDFILTPALVPRLFQLLSPQPHPCSSTNELASTYLKNTCGAWFRPSCHHCLHISWSVVCGADLPGVFLKKCRFLCPTSSPSYTHRIQFSGLGAREVHYKQEPRRCWYSLQFEKQCYILFDCLNNLVREILLLKSELYGEHPTWTLSPSFLVHQIVVYFHQFHWPFPHPQIKKHSLPPLIKSESSLKGCLWSKPSFCNCPTVFGHSDTFFFSLLFLSAFQFGKPLLTYLQAHWSLPWPCPIYWWVQQRYSSYLLWCFWLLPLSFDSFVEFQILCLHYHLFLCVIHFFHYSS